MPKEIITSPDLPPAKGPYSPAVRTGDLLFLSGQIPLDPASGQLHLGAIQEQTRLVLTNIEAILKAAGSSLDKVLKTTVYLTDIEDFAAMNEVYAGFFPADPPARTTIQAAALPLGIAVEIDVIALAS